MINLTSEELYYDIGFFKENLKENHISFLWNEIYKTTWIEDSIEKIYKKIPDWYVSSKTYSINGNNRASIERAVGQELLSKTPESLLEIGKDIINTLDSMSFFRRFYKNFEICYVDFWNGSEEIPYHFDTINGADTLILIYLTEQAFWKKEWGGQISLKKELGGQVVFEKEFDPLNGTCLVIDNSNPLITHKVTQLKNPSVNRYTLSFNIKWT